MIDIDKYEGISEDRVWEQYSTGLTSDYVYDYNVADEELVADAPKLLAEVKRLQALIRSKGLCTNCGQSHEGIEVVMDYSEDEVGHRISKECVDTCHPNLSIHCCDLCLCLNGFTIEHDYWEAKKND